MGAILPESKENELLKILRQDNAKILQEFIQLNQLTPDLLFTKNKRTLLQLSCYYESPKCLMKLIEMNYDYNRIETITGDTPLFICSKFNNLEMVKILLEKKECKKLVKNYENLNEFDISFLKGNYNICYYLMYIYDKKENNTEDKNDIKNNIEYENNLKNKEKNIISTEEKLVINNKSKINPEIRNNNSYDMEQIYQKYFYNTDFEYDYFLTLQAESKYPLFNMPLFFKCLCNKTLPSNCPSFAPVHKKTLDLTTKVPDPNETWGHFFKRIVNMELYNPPLVDKKNVSVMNSMYMNTQMKLMENEYGIKMNFYRGNNIDEQNEETKHPLDKEESDVIQLSKRQKKINFNEEETNNKNEKENNNDNEINENNIENNDKDNEGNLCIIKINQESSERNLDEEKANE